MDEGALTTCTRMYGRWEGGCIVRAVMAYVYVALRERTALGAQRGSRDLELGPQRVLLVVRAALRPLRPSRRIRNDASNRITVLTC